MTPDISGIVERTIHLQQLTNHLQMASAIILLIANGFIIWSIFLIRKATRINREWSASNAEWSARLREVGRSPPPA